MTEKKTHTKGPWVARESGGRGEWAIRREAAEIAGDVATVHRWNGLESANAHIIAAAPDLLEALEALLAFSSDFHMRDCALRADAPVCSCGVATAQRNARAAIARATGGDK